MSTRVNDQTSHRHARSPEVCAFTCTCRRSGLRDIYTNTTHFWRQTSRNGGDGRSVTPLAASADDGTEHCRAISCSQAVSSHDAPEVMHASHSQGDAPRLWLPTAAHGAAPQDKDAWCTCGSFRTATALSSVTRRGCQAVLLALSVFTPYHGHVCLHGALTGTTGMGRQPEDAEKQQCAAPKSTHRLQMTYSNADDQTHSNCEAPLSLSTMHWRVAQGGYCTL
jgi:hypothetical protein